MFGKILFPILLIRGFLRERFLKNQTFWPNLPQNSVYRRKNSWGRSLTIWGRLSLDFVSNLSPSVIILGPMYPAPIIVHYLYRSTKHLRPQINFKALLYGSARYLPHSRVKPLLQFLSLTKPCFFYICTCPASRVEIILIRIFQPSSGLAVLKVE